MCVTTIIDVCTMLCMFRFVLFLLGNGAPPRAVARLLVGGGLVRKPKEKRDAWDVFVAFRDGKLRPDAFYWCMRSRQRAEVNHPRSWCRGGVPARPGQREGTEDWAWAGLDT